MTRCEVVIPGVGQCEVMIGSHKIEGGRLVHQSGPCSWNGAPYVAVDDEALDKAALHSRSINGPAWEYPDLQNGWTNV